MEKKQCELKEDLSPRGTNRDGYESGRYNDRLPQADRDQRKVIEDQELSIKLKDRRIEELNRNITQLKKDHHQEMSRLRSQIHQLHTDIDARNEMFVNDSFEQKIAESSRPRSKSPEESVTQRQQIEQMKQTIQKLLGEIKALKQDLAEKKGGCQLIEPLENKIIINLTLERVDQNFHPISDSKKRVIRLKFQNRSTHEFIMVKEADPNEKENKNEDDPDSVCTLQVVENEDTKHIQEMQKIIEESHKRIQR